GDVLGDGFEAHQTRKNATNPMMMIVSGITVRKMAIPSEIDPSEYAPTAAAPIPRWAFPVPIPASPTPSAASPLASAAAAASDIPPPPPCWKNTPGSTSALMSSSILSVTLASCVVGHCQTGCTPHTNHIKLLKISAVAEPTPSNTWIGKLSGFG